MSKNKKLIYKSKLRLPSTICAAIVSIFVSSEANAGLLDNCSASTPNGCITKNLSSHQSGYYTLITEVDRWGVGQPGAAYLIDDNGNLVHTWSVGAFSDALPNGHLLAGFFYPGWSPQQQDVDCLVEVDWDGKVVWPQGANLINDPSGNRYCDPNGSIISLDTDASGRPVTRVHHDFQRGNNPGGYFAPGQNAVLAGGTTLILVNSNQNAPQISNFPLFNENIYEVQYNNGTNVLFKWNPVDHYNAGQGSPGDLGLGFSPLAQYLILNGVFNPALNKNVPIYGVGTSPHAPANATDWLHFNSMAYLGKNQWCSNPNSSSCDLRFHPDNIIFSSRQANIVGIIARHDNPGMWKSGDIVWRVGPDYAYGPGKIDQLEGQHHARMIPQGFPGAGNILVFDNGGVAGYPPLPNRKYSRVVEFNPVTLDIVWVYQQPLPTPPAGDNFAPFFSFFISSAQRLSNGDTFISEGATGRLFEVNSAGQLVWEFVSPFGALPPYPPFPPYYGIPSLGVNNFVYRAIRVPADWVPLQNQQ